MAVTVHDTSDCMIELPSKKCIHANRISNEWVPDRYSHGRHILSSTSDESIEWTQIMTDINNYGSRSQAKFINETLSIESDFDDFLDHQLKTMGIERAI